MKNKAHFLLLSILLIPFTALASGDDIFISFYVLIISFFIFLLTIVFIKIDPRIKPLLVILDMLALALILYLSKDIPYEKNKVILNIIILLIPIIITCTGYYFFKSPGKE